MFLTFFEVGPLTFLKIANPSSWYRVRFFLLYFSDNLWSRKLLTISHPSAPAKAPTAMPNNPLSVTASLTTSFTKQYTKNSKHQRSSTFLKYKTDYELSNEVWRIKKCGQKPVITWQTIQKCYLCI